MALKANDFTVNNEAERHEVDTPSGSLVVFVTPMTWIQQQQALSTFVDFTVDENGEMRPKIDFGGYWKYVLTNCIQSTVPSLSKSDLFNLKPEVGNAIQEILPRIEDLLGGISSEGEIDPLA